MSITTEAQAAHSTTNALVEAKIRKILVGAGAALVIAPFLTWGVVLGLVGVSFLTADRNMAVLSVVVGALAVLAGTGRLAVVMSQQATCLTLAILAGSFCGIETVPVFFSGQVSAGLGAYLIVAANAALAYVAYMAWRLTPQA